ncbi:MAG: type II secretion system F family protein [Acidimicrobiia bacterium]|nr:type II secretion system F family protein [Acidimicrobiia bacterium]NNL69340.1 type II secretion system F family protein [Acidimicrobiia bacterium]
MTAFVPALFSGIAAALLARWLVPPRRTLASRLNQYSVVGRASLGKPVDAVEPAPGTVSGTTLQRLFGPPVAGTARRLSQVIDTGGEAELLLRLRQADLLQDLPERDRANEYRVRQLVAAAAGVGIGALTGLVVLSTVGAAVGLSFIGFVVGATRWRGRVDRAIEERAERARIELYTVNQLLAMRTRAGGGVVQAVQLVAERGQGVVAGDLKDVIRLHRGGLPLGAAFQRMADLTPEPYASRTYRLLGGAEERGTDLSRALLALSNDVREARRDTLRRQATKRRAAMLIPIIAIMAPVMLLFIVAPVTEIVFGLAG